MKTVGVVGVVMLSGHAVAADILPNTPLDLHAIEAAHPSARVDRGDGAYELTLPDGTLIFVWQDSDGKTRYKSEDHSGLPAVGCRLETLVELVAVTKLCPGYVDVATDQQLDRAFNRIADFIGINHIPPLGDARAEVAGHVTQYMEDNENTCPFDAHFLTKLGDFARNHTQPGAEWLELPLSEPRLPANGPCH